MTKLKENLKRITLLRKSVRFLKSTFKPNRNSYSIFLLVSISITFFLNSCKEKIVTQTVKVTENSVEVKENKISIGSSLVKDAYFQIDNKLFFLENGFSGSDNYFFGDIKKWSKVHKDSPISLSNNFHYWTLGDGRNPNRV